ncbi:hypothetical protein D0469_17480 [Peribacillus saganii]|uniref:Uncharacterized protein n=1 Tax=Peribacillus saganii TaxID=2303992 RepID=A0A372LJ61_9BACI|nr:hypothetical protein [Peribacillus saganii]RFU66422.1 hypothetical protein D0469_17480 [Peribacillus saganii]
MDIRQYYRKTSGICFQVAWISLTLSILFFGLHAAGVLSGNILAIMLPFIILSIANYIGFRMFDTRAEEIPERLLCPLTEKSELLDHSHLLLAFLPAPTLRAVLFAPNGNAVGEIRDLNMKWYMWLIPNSVSLLLPKRYGLYSSDGTLIGSYQFKWGLFNKAVILNQYGDNIGYYREAKKESLFRLKGMIVNPEGKPWISAYAGGLLQEFQMTNADGIKLVSYKTGWMPFEWGNRFKDANTPILSFHNSATYNDKIAILGFCAAALHHRSN